MMGISLLLDLQRRIGKNNAYGKHCNCTLS